MLGVQYREQRQILSKEVNHMSLKIETKRCKRCGICVTFCPKKVLKVNEIEKVEIFDESNCIGCKQCELRCPDLELLNLNIIELGIVRFLHDVSRYDYVALPDQTDVFYYYSNSRRESNYFK